MLAYTDTQVMLAHRHIATHTQTCSHMAGYEDSGLHTGPGPTAGAQNSSRIKGNWLIKHRYVLNFSAQGPSIPLCEISQPRPM